MDPDNQSPPPLPPPAGPQPLGQPQAWQPTPVPPRPAGGSTRQEVVERLKQASNVLVTVSNNPSVDQLAACIGLTLMINKMNKHATAVFSGAIPSTIEFLQPEKTIEKNTDSLRDFIIALDKAKADKLRYKIEDKYVKIFITPYKTSLSEKDLEFSQGDFNVEVVMALGVGRKEELDQAITAHGRILHDATVISVNNRENSDIGAINWHDAGASSLCELLVSLGESLQPGVIDAQMATAFLTGIVAETERFSNGKTSAVTMGIASQLMKSGANQQLIATKLEKPKPEPAPEKLDPIKKDNTQPPQPLPVTKKDESGALQIPHEEHAPPPLRAVSGQDVSLPGETDNNVEKIQIDDQGELHKAGEVSATLNNPASFETTPPKLVLEPPTMGGTLTANTRLEEEQPSADPLSSPPPGSISNGSAGANNMPGSDFGSNTTNSRLFNESPATPPSSDISDARMGVSQAQQAGSGQRLDPVAALNAQPIDLAKPVDDSGQKPAGPPPPGPPPMMPLTLPPTDQNNNQAL
ncbi:MAG TPA: hypothetical protein VJJ78_02890 [Candidatus Saccharimonadales bacterium]|nr:hypothetical protein [Candidatus Saccharimonadales bacterium]